MIKNYYLTNEKQIRKDNESIYIPIKEITKSKDQIETIKTWISYDVDYKNEGNKLIFDKDTFYKWLDISEKKNFLKRFFS